MEKLNAEKKVREALQRLDRKRESIILRPFATLLIPIGVAVFVTWYSSTIIKENRVLKAANAKHAEIINQITANFFKVTGELSSGVSLLTAENASLKATNAEQAQTIKQITDQFFKATGTLP